LQHAAMHSRTHLPMPDRAGCLQRHAAAVSLTTCWLVRRAEKVEEKNCSYSQRDQAASRKLEEAYRAVDELKHANRQLDAQVLELDQENDSIFRRLEDTKHELGLSKEAVANARVFSNKLETFVFSFKRRLELATDANASEVSAPPAERGALLRVGCCRVLFIGWVLQQRVHSDALVK
jgi:septal ring factor EnvC (AmiA/AmiB activator)